MSHRIVAVDGLMRSGSGGRRGLRMLRHPHQRMPGLVFIVFTIRRLGGSECGGW